MLSQLSRPGVAVSSARPQRLQRSQQSSAISFSGSRKSTLADVKFARKASRKSLQVNAIASVPEPRRTNGVAAETRSQSEQVDEALQRVMKILLDADPQKVAKLAKGLQEDEMPVAFAPPPPAPPAARSAPAASPAGYEKAALMERLMAADDNLSAEELALAMGTQEPVAATRPAAKAPPPPPPQHDPAPTRVVQVNSGKEVFAKLVDTGVFRSKMPLVTVLLQSIMAGCFIGFGGILCSSVGGDVGLIAQQNPGLQRFLFGAIGFPLSIFLVTLTEMHAFTASLCLYTAAVFEGYTKKTRMTQVLTMTWIGNTAGLLLMAGLAVLGNMDCVKPCWEIAAHKLSASWWEIFFRGVGGGWLVCMAVVLATTANDVISKFIGIWMCISTYVICGWEHGLANIFFIPCAIMSGAPITWSAFMYDSLIPSTIGNTVGGIIMVGMALGHVHSAGKNVAVWGSGATKIKFQSPISME